MISTNLKIAKSIWRDKLRLLRIPLLDKLDIEYMKALELNNLEKQQQIAYKKQKLRDAPSDPRIDYASSIEELININPIIELGL